jgi:plastocyanin
MKTRIILSLSFMLLLAACAPAATPTPTSLPVNNPPASQETTTSNGTNIAITNFAFNPADITVPAGTTIIWTNMDGVAHTVVADDGSWKSENIAQGDTYSHTFSQAGIYLYHCGVHPSMTGKITVTP